MHWGHKLTIAIVAFVCLMGFMVYQALHTDFQLVEKGYYNSELKYQDLIDGNQRANQLSSKPTIVKAGNRVVLQLPEEMKNTVVRGSLWFYCAYDEKMDRKFEIQTDDSARQEWDADLFEAGNYVVKIEWSSGDRNYYSETKLTL